MLELTRLKVVAVLLLAGTVHGANKESTTFNSYVDTDLCSHLYAGPVSQNRVRCSLDTHKEGSNAVVIRLADNWIFQVNKEKMLNKLVGKMATASGQVNYGDSTMKLQTIEFLGEATGTEAGKNRPIADVRQSRSNTVLHEKIRHTLAMMPYISYFDFISFSLSGNTVTLTGWTTRPTNRSEAYNRVKQIEGVEKIINNLEVTPLSPNDNQIRAAALAALQKNLSRYFWGSGSDIRVVVKNGDIILLGTVASKADSDIATLRCNGIRNAFHVFNMLQVQPGEPKKASESGD